MSLAGGTWHGPNIGDFAAGRGVGVARRQAARAGREGPRRGGGVHRPQAAVLLRAAAGAAVGGGQGDQPGPGRVLRRPSRSAAGGWRTCRSAGPRRSARSWMRRRDLALPASRSAPRPPAAGWMTPPSIPSGRRWSDSMSRSSSIPATSCRSRHSPTGTWAPSSAFRSRRPSPWSGLFAPATSTGTRACASWAHTGAASFPITSGGCATTSGSGRLSAGSAQRALVLRRAHHVRQPRLRRRHPAVPGREGRPGEHHDRHRLLLLQRAHRAGRRAACRHRR